MDKQTEFAADGIQDAIRHHTVGIVAQQLRGIGTGFLVLWRRRHLILTAAHVLEGTAPSELRFFLPADRPPAQVDRRTVLTLPGVKTSDLLAFSELSLGPIERDTRLDLAAIPVDQSLDGRHDSASFFDLRDGGTMPPVEKDVWAYGFPHDLTRMTHENAGVVSTHCEWTEVGDPTKYRERIDTSTHFVAPFSLAEPEAHPRGMSGSAAWYRMGNTPGVWHPNLEIGGLFTHYDERTRLLKAVRRERVEEFLRGRYY